MRFLSLSRGGEAYCRQEAVIHRLAKVLLAAKVAFRRLNRRVAQEKLNLLQLASAVVA